MGHKPLSFLSLRIKHWQNLIVITFILLVLNTFFYLLTNQLASVL